jgi:hypothetical protein
MERATYLYWHIACWFESNPPGALVPEWCELAWPIREEEVERLIALFEEETGLKIEDGGIR